MRASNRTTLTAMCLFCAAFTGCEGGSDTPTGGAGGSAGSAGASEETTVTLAGPGPYFRVVQEGYEQSARCYLPGPPARDGWELDEFAFAP